MPGLCSFLPVPRRSPLSHDSAQDLLEQVAVYHQGAGISVASMQHYTETATEAWHRQGVTRPRTTKNVNNHGPLTNTTNQASTITPSQPRVIIYASATLKLWLPVHWMWLYMCSYKRVKGRSHSVKEKTSTHSYKSNATSQPSLSHTLSLTAQPTQQPTTPKIHDGS